MIHRCTPWDAYKHSWLRPSLGLSLFFCDLASKPKGGAEGISCPLLSLQNLLYYHQQSIFSFLMHRPACTWRGS